MLEARPDRVEDQRRPAPASGGRSSSWRRRSGPRPPRSSGCRRRARRSGPRPRRALCASPLRSSDVPSVTVDQLDALVHYAIVAKRGSSIGRTKWDAIDRSDDVDLDGIDPHVYARRWKTLAVLCTSLIIVIVGNTVLNVALPTLQLPPEQGGLGATNTEVQWIVDAYGLVFAGLLFTGRRARRPLRPQGRAAGRPRRVRGRLGARRLRRRSGDADRRPGGDGRRRGVRHAVDAVDPDQRVPGPGAGQGDRHLGRHLRQPAPRSDRSRPACCWSTSGGARCSSSTCRSSPPPSIAGYVLVPKSKDATRDAARPGRRACCRSSASARWCTPSSRAQPRLGERRVAAVVRRRRHRPAGVRAVGVAQPPSDARPAPVPEPAVRRLVRRHHAGVLRHVRHVLPALAVPAGGPRLHAARGRGPHAAVLGGDDGRRPEHAEARRPLRRRP